MKALIASVALLAACFSADAATSRHHPAHTPQIACTEVGCLPVPPQCTIAGGKTFDGTPTGFDVMVCPDGIRYGHL